MNIEIGICILFLILFLWKILKQSFTISPALVSIIFRVSLVTIYFYTGFHKLNTDFFNPCTSCVNKYNELFISNFTGKKILLSENVSTFFQYATIFLEMVLPFGLFWRQTRAVTAILLLSFHIYLGYTLFADFEALIVFMMAGCTLDFEKKQPNPKLFLGLKIYVLIAMCAIFVKPFLYKLFKGDIILVNFTYGNIFNIGVILFLIFYFRNNKMAQTQLPKKLLIYPIILFLLISCWALKAYFGFGNSANLTMFSNLMTESNRNNHFLIDTKKTKMTDWEEDSVLILKLHDTLKSYKLENFKLPITEFHYQSKLFSKHFPEVKLNATVVYKNDTIKILDLKNSKYAETRWWYKYINFRKIQPEGPNECLW